MNKDLEEVIEVVGDLNDAFSSEDIDAEIQIITNGMCFRVEFLSALVCSSEDDERLFDEDNNEYEPWNHCIKRIIKELVNLDDFKHMSEILDKEAQ